MRLLVASQHFWPEPFRINDVVQHLQAAGCTVTVLTGQPNYPDGQIYDGYRAAAAETEEWHGIQICRVPLVPRGAAGSLRLAANYISYLLSALLIGPWLLRGRHFDAILVYGTSPILQAIPAILLKRLKRAPLVTWVQDLWPESLAVTGHVRNRHVLGAVDRVVRWIYRRNDLLLGQSEAFVQAIAPKAAPVPVHHHPNPGDRASATKPERYPLGGGFPVVFAGNLGKAQALPTILEAAAAVQDVPALQIHLFGSGSQESWLRAEVAARGLANVHLHGRVPPTTMPRVFAAASALLLTLGRSEILAQTVPSKLQTYLQAGRPILAAIDGEGASVVRTAGAGFVVPAEDAAALAAAMLALYRTASLDREIMGESGQRYFADHFDPAVLTARLIGLLQLAGASPMPAGEREFDD